MSMYLSKDKLKKMGFINIGKDCKISDKISCYDLKCSIGDRVRIDDDVSLKGKINIKSNVHIGRGCTLSGASEGIYIDNLCC